MSFSSSDWRQLKNISADQITRALERDDWFFDESHGSIRIYRHPDGRRVSIHYHPRKTFGPKLLKEILKDIGWAQDELRKLKLIK